MHKMGQSSFRAAQFLHVRSALNPLLWLTGIAMPVCLTFAYVFRDYPFFLYLLVIVGLLPIAITCVGFLYFAWVRPEKLQSEDYQIRHESLQLIQEKSGAIEGAGATIDQIVNPAARQLEHKEGE